MKRTSVFAGTAVTLLLFVAVTCAQDSREITKTLPLKADGEVLIDTYKGSITVDTWDKNEVDIQAKIEADDTFDAEYAAEKVRDTEVRIDASDSRVRIKTDYDNIRDRRHHFWSWFDGDQGSLPLVHYTIHMPATASLNVKDYRSKSSISHVRSNVVFNTYRGEVEMAEMTGPLNLETYRGEARIGFQKMGDHCRCETYRGSITLSLPGKGGFDLDADLGYRTHFSSDFGVDLDSHGRHHRNSEFHGPVNGGGASLVLRSTKGTIRIRQR